jgi:uncharacterized RDD family membrane protein YckC
MPYAGVGRRAVAVILDLFIIATFTGPIWLNSAFFTAAAEANPSRATTQVLQFAASPWTGLLLAAIPFVYFTLLEGFFGATAGKMLLGMRVVQLGGSPITWREAIVRNLLRPIDEIVFYLVGAISIWSSPRKQRLGDRAADTVVVRVRPTGLAAPSVSVPASGASTYSAGDGSVEPRTEQPVPPVPPA